MSSAITVLFLVVCLLGIGIEFKLHSERPSNYFHIFFKVLLMRHPTEKAGAGVSYSNYIQKLLIEL